jgi:3-oxoacyl-[acyl-carrier-protein] synthase II
LSVLVSACAAGADAIGAAARALAAGDYDAALSGGSEAARADITAAGLSAMDAISKSGSAVPSMRGAMGFVMGEAPECSSSRAPTSPSP